jgi:hypothetical protein
MNPLGLDTMLPMMTMGRHGGVGRPGVERVGKISEN